VLKVFNKKFSLGLLVLLFYIGLFLIFYFWSTPIEYLKELTKADSLFAPLILITVSFLEVIIAPITVLPLLPPLSLIFGPFWAGTYILLGWILGSMVAFYIARRFGRPILGKFISLKSVEKYENYVPKEMEFWWVFLLRFIIQVDALSYALGLFSRISFWKFSLATLLSFAPVVYIVSYAGEALLMREFRLFAIFSLILIIIFIVLSYFYYRRGRVKEEIKEEYKEEHKNV